MTQITVTVTPRAHGSEAVLAGAARAWSRCPRLAVAAIGALAVQQLFAIGFGFSLKSIVDDVTKHQPGSKLAVLLAVLVVGFVVAAAAAVIGERAAARGAALIINNIRRDLYAHLLELSPGYFLTTPAGKLVNRFDSDLKSLQGGYVDGFLNTVVLVISAVITVPLLLWLDWRLALIAFVLLPLVIVAVDRLLPRSVDANDALSGSRLRIINTVQDTIRAQQVVRTFHLEEVLRERFDEILENQEIKSVHASGLAALVSKGASLAVLFVELVVIVVGAELAAHGDLSLGSLVAFITVLGLIASDVYSYARSDLALLAEAGRGGQGLDDLLSAPVIVIDRPTASPLLPVQGAIAFQQVSFGYNPDERVLNDVSFEIPPRGSVAFVGANGSGKSTVLGLLMRFYDPQHGAITVDSTDVRDVTQRSLRSQMSVVLQTNFIFNDTIRENIRIGNPDATDDEIVEAAKRAELHDFVMNLPEGYDTVVGESGGRLSGGQRQRLAIARAMIRDPKILLLDEVTTALDPATEAAVNAMLSRMRPDRTMVSVTHRLASARDADKILVMDHGRLVQQGDHDSLVREPGQYRTLWEKQSGFDVSHDGRQATVDGARLRHVTLFTDLDDATLDRIAGTLTSEFFDAEQTVFSEGQPGDRFYLIARGQVKVITVGPAGEDHVLDLLSDGDHFGELALIQDRPRTATIRTATPSVFLTMSRQDFLDLVASTPEMSRMLEERMTRSELNLDEWRRLLGQGTPR